MASPSSSVQLPPSSSPSSTSTNSSSLPPPPLPSTPSAPTPTAPPTPTGSSPPPTASTPQPLPPGSPPPPPPPPSTSPVPGTAPPPLSPPSGVPPPPPPQAVPPPPPQKPQSPPPVSSPPPKSPLSPPVSTPPNPNPPQAPPSNPSPPKNSASPQPSPPKNPKPPPTNSRPPPDNVPSPPPISSPPPESPLSPPVVTPPNPDPPQAPSSNPSPPKSSTSPPPPPPKNSASPPPPQSTNSASPPLSPSGSSVSPPPSPPKRSQSPPTNPTPSAVQVSPPSPSRPSGSPAPPSPNGTANVMSTSSGGIKTGPAVAIGIVMSILTLSLIVMAVWIVRKRKKSKGGSKFDYTMPSPHASSQNSDALFLRPQSSASCIGNGSGDFMYSPSEPGGVGKSRPGFPYEELVEATNGFSVENLLGEGGFGSVYKGSLIDGREVAVKQLKIGGGQGEREFRAEVDIISRVHHRHLVSLVGYCISEHQRLLVYDYVPNETLHYHLHGDNRPVMEWAIRVRVSAGAARGIAYLHEDCHPRIIHRDIKSSNILLDNNFEAQVSDFGLAKLALDAYTHVTTRVMGTFGYMAPEYASSGKLTEKSDVFSFGVVLLELITGRKPVDASQPLGDESLVEWARPLLTHALDNQEFDGLVDPRLGNNFVKQEMLQVIEAAAACVRHSASKRPRMSQVVRALDLLSESSDLSNGMRPGQSEMFDVGPDSEQIRMFQRMAFDSQEYSSSDFYEHGQSSWTSRSGSPAMAAGLKG